MTSILKRAASVFLLVWAACLLLFCVILPRFQKTVTRPKPLPTPAAHERVRCINDNEEALTRRLQIIESAENELILSTYYYGSDEAALDITSALQAAADRGVHIRILVDGVCAFTSVNNSHTFRALCQMPNVEARIYNPVNLLIPWRINYRMHDKYLIADDTLYMLGGRNTRNVSLGNYTDKQDMDRDLVVYREQPDEGSSLNQVKAYFEEVWSLKTNKVFQKTTKKAEVLQNELRDHYRQLRENQPGTFSPVDWPGQTLPTNGVTLLHNPTQAGRKAPTLWKDLAGIMGSGRKVLIQTPYIICNHMMYEDLRSLTGDVKVITNAPECGANPCGCADYLNQRHRLRSSGLEIYEYAGLHSAHTKTVLVDDRISVVGSFNFDMRSAYLDTEMMLLVDSPQLNEELRELDRQYMASSRCIRSDGTRVFGEDFVKPYMPIPKYILYWVLRLVTFPLRHLL